MLLEGVDLQNRGERTHLDIPRMREGLLDGVFFAIYTPAALDYKAAVEHSLSLISKCYDFVDCNRDKVAFAFSTEEALQNKEKGQILPPLFEESGTVNRPLPSVNAGRAASERSRDHRGWLRGCLRRGS
jgi:membrane dipeptidase